MSADLPSTVEASDTVQEMVPPPLTPDHMSLQDCPADISTTKLWDAGSVVQPVSSDPTAQRCTLVVPTTEASA